MSTECIVPGCNNPARKKGICLAHHQENYVGCCTVEGCTRNLFCRGRCKPHYMRLRRKKEGKNNLHPDAPIRGYGQELFSVFTRIPRPAADVILKAAGHREGMYAKIQEILTDWAEQHAA